MTKDEAIRRAGSASNLARMLGVTRQAVSKWGDDLPALRRYQLKEMRPHWFRKRRLAQ